MCIDPAGAKPRQYSNRYCCVRVIVLPNVCLQDAWCSTTTLIGLFHSSLSANLSLSPSLSLSLSPSFFSGSYQLNSQKQMLSEQLSQNHQEMEVQAESLLSALQEKEEMAKEKAQLDVELTALERNRKLLTEEVDTLR